MIRFCEDYPRRLRASTLIIIFNKKAVVVVVGQRAGIKCYEQVIRPWRRGLQADPELCEPFSGSGQENTGEANKFNAARPNTNWVNKVEKNIFGKVIVYIPASNFRRGGS